MINDACGNLFCGKTGTTLFFILVIMLDIIYLYVFVCVCIHMYVSTVYMCKYIAYIHTFQQIVLDEIIYRRPRYYYYY